MIKKIFFNLKKGFYVCRHMLLPLLLIVSLLTGCGSTPDDTGSSQARQTDADVPVIDGLTYESTMDLSYAECFDVYYYSGGYALIDVHDSAQYLVVPEGAEVPDHLSEEIIVLQQPLDHIYLAATSAMALFDSLDALDSIRFSGTQASGWYVENASAAMERGDILFAGKYSEPDYELLIDEGCDLAVESTMILHTPKVQEMLESLDIPVFTDRSSYESHPLGRTEWIRLYSVLVDKEETADEFFQTQEAIIENLEDFENTEKTVAFFYVSTNGTVIVRKTDDYIPRMIEIAGGRYIFDDLTNEESSSAAVNLTMEEFYAQAADADYLVYNSSIDNALTSIDELLAKDELFADFRAVQEGNVWCTGKYLYQATDILGEIIKDFHLMLTDGSPEEMTFLYHVD